VGQCKAAVAAGAQFVVSPVLDEKVVKEAARSKTTMVPGCSTPSEMHRAHQLGCPIQKLFPEPAGGQSFVTSALGALPFLSVFPTHCDEESGPSYLAAGCKVIGMGNTYLAPDEDIKKGRWSAITDRAITLRKAIETWQAERKCREDKKSGKGKGKTGNRNKKKLNSAATQPTAEGKASDVKANEPGSHNKLAQSKPKNEMGMNAAAESKARKAKHAGLDRAKNLKMVYGGAGEAQKDNSTNKGTAAAAAVIKPKANGTDVDENKLSPKEVAQTERARAREALAELTSKKAKVKGTQGTGEAMRGEESTNRLERALQLHSARHDLSAYDNRSRQWRP